MLIRQNVIGGNLDLHDQPPLRIRLSSHILWALVSLSMSVGFPGFPFRLLIGFSLGFSDCRLQMFVFPGKHKHFCPQLCHKSPQACVLLSNLPNDIFGRFPACSNNFQFPGFRNTRHGMDPFHLRVVRCPFAPST